MTFADRVQLAALGLALIACAAAPEPAPSPAREPATAPVVEAPPEPTPAPTAPRPVEARPAPVETRASWPTPGGAIDVVLLGEGALGVIVLHGHGATPEDMVPFARELASAVPVRIAVPTSPRTWRFGGEGRAWFERGASDTNAQVERARGEVDAIRAGLVLEGHPHVVVVGFSQGASLAIETALEAGARDAPFRALVALSARDLSRFRRRFDALQGLDVFVSHGRADRLIPFVNGERIAARAEEAGARVTFVSFAGDHEIPIEVRDALVAFLVALSP